MYDSMKIFYTAFSITLAIALALLLAFAVSTALQTVGLVIFRRWKDILELARDRRVAAEQLTLVQQRHARAQEALYDAGYRWSAESERWERRSNAAAPETPVVPLPVRDAAARFFSHGGLDDADALTLARFVRMLGDTT